MKRLGVAALCLVTACTRHDDIRPADVPRLAQLENGGSVQLETTDGSSMEISHYKEVRLYSKSGASDLLVRRQLHVQEWQGQVWLQSGEYRPIPFDPRSYSRAELLHREANVPLIVVGAVVGLVVLGAALQSSGEH